MTGSHREQTQHNASSAQNTPANDTAATSSSTHDRSDAAAASSSGSGEVPVLVKALADRLERQALDGRQAQKARYAFWETQPVAQFEDGSSKANAAQSCLEGPIDPPKTVEDVKQQPYTLPQSFEWCVCNMKTEEEVKEVYSLLGNNYVEDDDNMFRFNYSPAFLEWALHPPGYKETWHVGIRVSKTKKLVAFISAIPASIFLRKKKLTVVEINYLCIHKKLRSRRLAPVLIKEITRRVNLHGIWHAVYTAGVVLPTPVSVCRYYHRPLNPKKLIEVGFSRLAPRMTMARTLKLLRLPDQPCLAGIRSMKRSDAPHVQKLLQDFLAQFQLSQAFSVEEVEHWFLPQADVIESFVVEADDGRLTDFVSFYALPSTILGHPTYTDLKAAYMCYTVPGAHTMCQLMQDALILAKGKGYDVFNALDLMHNEKFLKELKFGIGDGQLRYYLYNWRIKDELNPQNSD